MKTAINLLPPVYRRQRFIRRRVIQWSAVLVATLWAIGVAGWYRGHAYHALQRQLAAVARASQPAQAMLREITTLRTQIDKLRQYQTIAQELEQQRQVLALLGAVSQAARRTDGRLRVVDCRVVDLQATEVAENPADGTLHPGTVTLVGVALDSPTVAEFHDGLIRSGRFADVKLIKSNERNQLGPELFDYEVRCEL
jgi:cell division protein FtsB